MAGPSPDDPRLHARIKEAYDEQEIRLLVDPRFLNRPGSPVFSTIENLGPLLFMLFLSLGLLFLEPLAGILAMVVTALTQAYLLQPWAIHQAEARALKALLASPHGWMIIWAYGGVAITLGSRPQVGVAAPDGDWRAFARRYLGVTEMAASAQAKMAAQFGMRGDGNAMESR